MNEHARIQRQLSHYHDLDAGAKLAVRRHLAQCAPCAAHWIQVQAQDQLVADFVQQRQAALTAAQRSSMPQTLAQLLARDTQGTRPPQPSRAPRQLWAAAGMLALLLLVVGAATQMPVIERLLPLLGPAPTLVPAPTRPVPPIATPTVTPTATLSTPTLSTPTVPSSPLPMATLALNPLANPDFWGFYLGYSPGAPPPPPSLDALLAQAPLIVFGEVGPVDAYTEFATYDENGQPITDREGDFWASIGSTEFQLRVEEVWRDDGTIARGAPLILRMVGHADAVRKAWSQNADYPLSYTGDRHLFLLSPYPDGQAYGFYYGPWSRLIVEGSELYVSNGNRDPLRFAADEPPLTLDELRLAVASSPAPVIDLPVRPTPLPASTAATADVAQWPEYRHEQLGVSVRYPSDWQPWDRTAAAIRFGKSGQDEAFNVVNAGVQLDTISDFLQHIEPAATFTRTIQVDGQPALFMRFEPTQAAAAGYQSVVGILMPDGRAITVGNKTVDPIQFEQIVRTIRLFEPTLPP